MLTMEVISHWDALYLQFHHIAVSAGQTMFLVEIQSPLFFQKHQNILGQ
jgi:prolyl-tRNA editing enzyme YbaK/EbsC (Cys-tRNA(Pro) deacylase)